MRVIIEVRSNKFESIADSARKAAEDAVAQATLDAQEYAISFAPVETGNLRGSITNDIDGLNGAIYTGVEYSAHQEFGTYKMPAHPYFTPAIEAVTDQFRKDMEDIFGG